MLPDDCTNEEFLRSCRKLDILASKFSHITPQLKKLHWFPVRYRVQFKIGLITYKILNQGQPVYLRELIHPYTSFRNTRHSTPKLKFLHTPTFDHRVHKSIKHFSNSFSHYAPILWNSLPFQISPSVATFRKHLKTHLFNSSFPTSQPQTWYTAGTRPLTLLIRNDFAN